MTGPELINCPDALVWAREFKRTFGDNVVDEDTMFGWFANAMEAGRLGAAAPPSND